MTPIEKLKYMDSVNTRKSTHGANVDLDSPSFHNGWTIGICLIYKEDNIAFHSEHETLEGVIDMAYERLKMNTDILDEIYLAQEKEGYETGEIDHSKYRYHPDDIPENPDREVRYTETEYVGKGWKPSPTQTKETN